MNYETMKSFILFVLVGISFLLSFILWSYQPNYDYLYDSNYVNEVDVGGKEKTKNELFDPAKIIFKNGDTFKSFKDQNDLQNLYRDMASWVMYDYTITQANGRPEDDRYVEVTYQNVIPAELITNLFTFNDEIEPPDWSFDRVFMIPNDKDRSVDVSIMSIDDRSQITATIDKTETYQTLVNYLTQEKEALQENIEFTTEHNPIYLPKEKVNVPKKTVIASTIDPDLFKNALFRNPSLVTSNIREAYFTDGQRGMRIMQDGLRLEFVNPIQSNYDRLSALELIEKSVNKINEHKGWTNNFTFNGINRVTNNISYRLTYDGYPVFDHNSLSVIEQEWRDQELYEYSRPLVVVGNVLNTEDVELISGEDVIKLLEMDHRQFKLENIKDIRVGYYLNFIDDAHSLTLEPSWFILYENEWTRFSEENFRQEIGRGES